VKTTEEMAGAVDEIFAESDYLIMAAAPADYRPLKTENNKIKKSDKNMDIRLIPTTDILKQVASKKRDNQIVVGFSLETENEIENSRKKLRAKNLDYIVVNNPKEDGAGFEVDTNRVIIIDKSGTIEKINKNLKPAIANQIWGYILAHGRK
jgi:phosphopantothenoylcysteine decarboxylase/phosphopantothenate--cysteine ligase